MKILQSSEISESFGEDSAKLSEIGENFSENLVKLSEISES